MIFIEKIAPPENHSILEKFPQLNHIWENEVMQKRALKSYEVWNPKEKTGEIFLIKKDNDVIGVTGWWTDEHVLDTIRLRWHGIVENERGKGYSSEALKLLMEHINTVSPSQYRYISESFSVAREASKKVRQHFEKLGFVEFEDPSYGTNGLGETISLRVPIPSR
jgi:RimJ/RimL family protein N-acetyltransferase